MCLKIHLVFKKREKIDRRYKKFYNSITIFNLLNNIH